jgi:uncharacterized membrane protein
MQHEAAPRRERVGIGELWRWAAPWLLGALLVAVTLLGLFAASRARTDGDYAVGLLTAGLALLALGWRIKRALDGETRLAPLPVLVDEGAALVILVALLTVLAVAGLLLAARSGESMLEAVGYALFGFSLVFIFWNLKHYFDRSGDRAPG